MRRDNRNPYQDVDHAKTEEHPIDILVRKNPKVQTLSSKVKEATEQMELVAEARVPWLELEALLNEYRQAREELHFNFGYQHGFAAGEAHTLRNFKPEIMSSEYQRVAESVRNVVMKSSLPVSTGVAALSEAAWALAFMMLQDENH